MMTSNKILGVVLILMYTLIFQYSYAQNLDGLYDLLENKAKEIDKALQDISEAGKLTQEANNYYNKISELQSDYSLDEKNLQKELTKTEEKALSLQLKADKLYAGTYKNLSKLCLGELKSSGLSDETSNPFVNSSNEMMSQAAEKREEASNTKDVNEKASLLNDAAGLESAAIDNFIAALQVQKGIIPESSQQIETEEDYKPYVSTSETENVNTSQDYDQTSSYAPSIEYSSENLAIDQSVIKEYQDYINDPTIPDPITINRSGVTGVSDVSIDNARDIFFGMHTGDTSLYKPIAALSIEEQQAITDSTTGISEESTRVTDKLVTEAMKSEEYRDLSAEQTSNITEQGSDAESKQKGDKTTIHTRESIDVSYSHQSSGVRFMVQIAASRAPLTRSQLWAIYPGNNSVEVVREGGWYKYRIGAFRTFSDANRVALESGVESAWVLSRNENIPITIKEAKDMTRVLESDVKRYGTKAIKQGVDFYVQLAASKIRLNENQRESLCGSQICREVIENGWFKYQIYAGTDYQQAIDLKNGLSAKSFIVAYERGMKLRLRDAKNR